MSTLLKHEIHPASIQGTPQWLESRKYYIGASEASSILGYNKYTSAYDLWQERLGIKPVKESNYYMKRGSLLETVALNYLEKQENIIIVDNPVLVSNQVGFLRASLDGVSSCGRYIAEVKCPRDEYSETHVHASIGNAPCLMHYTQIQFCLWVARDYYPDLKGAFYVSYIDSDVSKSIICEVLYDEKFCLRMVEECKAFWNHLQNKTPPKMNESEYQNIEVAQNKDQWHSLISRYKEVIEKKKFLEEEEKGIRSELELLSANQNVKGFGFSLSYSERKGAIDYKKIRELKGVDLDVYRKDPSIVSTIRIS